jgi:transposase-like protein
MGIQARAIDATINELRTADPVGAAAMEMRYKGVCPVCGRYSITISAEESNTGARVFACRSCQWTVTVGEPQYRGDPAVQLRGVVEAARMLAKRPTLRRPQLPTPTPAPGLKTPQIKPSEAKPASRAGGED